MRRFLALAIITALGAWALKRLAEVGNNNACYEGMPQFSAEEEDLQSQTVDDLGDELTPSPSDEEIHLESVDSVVDEAPLPSDEEEDLQSQTVEDFRGDAIPLPWEEEVHAEPQPTEASVFDGVEIQGPPDLDQRLRTGDDWSLPAGPEEEEKLRQARAEVDERFRNVSDDRQREDGAVA